MSLHTTIPGAFAAALLLAIPRTTIATCTAGAVLFVIGAFAAKDGFARARGLYKAAALANLCFAVPLAIFGAEHFADSQSIVKLVPSYMPAPMFWVYFVGAALLAASLSIATKIQAQWSGLLLGIMMLLFVAMMDIPGALASPRDRISWVLVLREMSFGGGGWLLAAAAMNERHARGRRALLTAGRVFIGLAAVFYGVQSFLHPLHVPGVPLEKMMPAWMPARTLISFVTGAVLLVSGVLILVNRKTRAAAGGAGAWILLLVVIVYVPILIAALMNPGAGVQIEGINYFGDTLLFAGAILALAHAAPRAA